MRRFKKFLIIILLIPLLNIILITICNGLIESSWWKYSRGADFKDSLEFDENLQAKGILIQKDGKTEKVIFLYLFDYMILSDMDLTNWTYYARKGKKYDMNDTANPQQVPTKITGTPGDKRLLDSLMKNRQLTALVERQLRMTLTILKIKTIMNILEKRVTVLPTTRVFAIAGHDVVSFDFGSLLYRIS